MPQLNYQHITTYIRREKAICLLPLIAIWLGLTLSPNWHPTWDSAMYITMGKSIITGGGSRYMGYGGIKYPPGFPFMLGLIIGPFGYNFLLMRMLLVGCAVGAAWLAYLMVRNRSNRWIATGVMCSTVFSFPFIFECTRILSDIPYAFLSLLALYWIERYAKPENPWRGKIGYITLGLILASYFTRIVGLTLFTGAIAYLVIDGFFIHAVRGTEKERKGVSLKKAIAIGVVLFTVPPIWMAQNHLRGPKLPPELREALSYEKELLVPTAADPKAQLIDWKILVERIQDNERYYEALLSNIVLGKQTDSKTRARIITLILLAGYLYCLIRHRSVLEYYTFFYMLTYILWTSKQGERFLVPIIPILYYYLFRLLTLVIIGVRRLVRRVTQWDGRWDIIEAAAVVVLTVVFIQWNWASDVAIIKQERRDPYYSERNVAIIDLARWLKTNTPPDALVVSDQPSYVYLFSDRKTFSFPWIQNPAEVLESINRVGATYVVSMPGGRSEAYLHPTLEAYADHFEVVRRQGDYVIYRVKL
jgi:hypothetical protein